MDDTRSRIAHLYRRAGFGARPDELDAAVGKGYEATVEALLSGLRSADPAGDAVAPPQLAVYHAPPTSTSADPLAKLAANRQQQMNQNQEILALQGWWLNRMIVTSTPLREKLTLLWHNHFATGFVKVRNAALMYRQNQLFRSMGSGNFEVLTQAIAKDPAMMYWLDTQTDVASHPNENFARELMELFTLGIGNYTEDDVKAGARCFTGWAFNPMTGDYVLRARLHDSGWKTLLGQTGAWGGEDVVRIVTHHPASLKWIPAKLWSHLAYPVSTDDPIVAGLAAGYQRDLDITSLLRAIFLHPGFTSPAARGGLVKQPIEYVVGIARAFGLDASGQQVRDLDPAGGVAGLTPGRAANGTTTTLPPRRATKPVALPGLLRTLAQEPFDPPNVAGWPQNEYWLTTATAQLRLQYGYAVGSAVDLSALSALAPANRADALAHLLSIDGWGPTTAAALNHVAADPATLVALALSTPEYVLN
ncbi:MAG TPA: DUF1800 domain-containing protein [Acidimicrobiales bacterium]|nr:DUF1800 domain-containing protein [Acidimicrobiales bacterium]